MENSFDEDSVARNEQRIKIAKEIAVETYATDDVVIFGFDGGVDPKVEPTDEGYWVEAQVWVNYEEVEERMGDPKRQAILNIQAAQSRVTLVWDHSQNDELNEALAELQQAVRFLTGEETPS